MARSSWAVAGARVFVFNMKQVGIDVDVKYFDQAVLFEKAGRRGEPYDVVWAGWVVDYADPAARTSNRC